MSAASLSGPNTFFYLGAPLSFPSAQCFPVPGNPAAGPEVFLVLPAEQVQEVRRLLRVRHRNHPHAAGRAETVES